jgi:hypothetical protein
MKFTKILLALTAVCAVTFTASAQRGFDEFGVPVADVLQAPALLTAVNTTSAPVDVRVFDGLAAVYISSLTNAGGAVTATIETSADTTNWTALANYAQITSTTSIIYTNSANTSIYATSVYLIPGTYTTPVAATSGLAAVKYLAPLPYTNSGALTITKSGVYEIGWSIGDSGRYAHIVWNDPGEATNSTAVSAIIVGDHQFPLQ